MKGAGNGFGRGNGMRNGKGNKNFGNGGASCFADQ